MALQGTLDTFALPDVLHLLAATKKTGCVRLTGSRGSGTVAVDGGAIVSVTADHAPRSVDLAGALFELLRFEDGSFAFDPDVTVEGAGSAEDVDALLEGAGALLAEWRDIESVVPSLGARVRLRAELGSKSVTISRDQWPTLVAVGEGTTVGGLGDRLGLAELPISRVVRDLVELGVVDVAPADERPVDEPSAVVADEPEPVVEEPVSDEMMAGAHFADPVTAAADADDDAWTSADVAWSTDAEPPEAAPATGDSDVVVRAPVGADDGAPDEALPTAPPIRARRPRPRTYELNDVDDEPFVPLELPGSAPAAPAPAAYDHEPATEDDAVSDLAAAFPGLASHSTSPADDEDVERQLDTLSPRAADAVRLAAGLEESEPSAADDDPDLTMNRGLLLKFLGSVKS